MPTKVELLTNAMFRSAVKRVSKTDISKKAYVVNKDQRAVLEAAGYIPGNSSDPPIIQLEDPLTGVTYPSSYYNSERVGADRDPEPRMGQSLFNLIKEGDSLFIGTDGRKVFASVIVDSNSVEVQADIDRFTDAVYQRIDLKLLAQFVNNSPRKAVRKPVIVVQVVRNPAVKALVILRCQGKCEVPNCGWEGFEKQDGTRFIEVHHIDPLGNDGDDTIWNTIGICPNCHATATYAKEKDSFNAKLMEVVRIAMENFRQMNPDVQIDG